MTHSVSASRRLRLGRPARWARRNLRFLITAVVVLAFMLALVLFARTYSTGSDPGAPGAGGGGLPAATGSTPTPSDSASRAPAATGVPKRLPRYTITPGEPGGFTYLPLPTHRLVMSVSSAGPIGQVGYLVPTSPDHSYGRAEHVGTSWAVATTVTGKPYYALIFVQANRTGLPITCTITIDGRVASRKSTSGAYGRQVCLA